MLAGLAVVLVAAGARYADVFVSAAPLEFSDGADWWSHQDYAREANVTA
jgi:hypothetical protein